MRGETYEGRNVPLELRGAKCVRGETWDIIKIETADKKNSDRERTVLTGI